MGVFDFNSLHAHAGHRISCVEYGNKDTGCVNVAIECEDCNEVLVDFNKPDDEKYVPLSPKDFLAVCPECFEASSLEKWNKATSAECGEDIVPLIEEDFSNHGFVGGSSAAACAYVCPCCLRTVIGATIKER